MDSSDMVLEEMCVMVLVDSDAEEMGGEGEQYE
jgi:hypothetical protein